MFEKLSNLYIRCKTKKSQNNPAVRNDIQLEEIPERR